MSVAVDAVQLFDGSTELILVSLYSLQIQRKPFYEDKKHKNEHTHTLKLRLNRYRQNHNKHIDLDIIKANNTLFARSRWLRTSHSS